MRHAWLSATAGSLVGSILGLPLGLYAGYHIASYYVLPAGGWGENAVLADAVARLITIGLAIIACGLVGVVGGGVIGAGLATRQYSKAVMAKQPVDDDSEVPERLDHGERGERNRPP
jgi:Na+/glutamate symporter